MEQQDNKTLIIPFSEYKKMEDEIKMFREKEHALSVNVRIRELKKQIERLELELVNLECEKHKLLVKCGSCDYKLLEKQEKIKKLEPYKQKYEEINNKYNDLLNKYNDLLNKYNDLLNKYNDLLNKYNDLLNKYNEITENANNKKIYKFFMAIKDFLKNLKIKLF